MAIRARRPATTVAAAAVVAVAGCGGAPPTRPMPSPAPSGVSSIADSAPPVKVAQAPRRLVGPSAHRHPARAARAPSPGALPQTDRLPSHDTHQFAAEMHALWRAIRTGSPQAGRAALFPEGAYAQVKAIAYPAADYEYRLLVDYRLDLAAAHALLGADARAATLVAVHVPSAHRVDPQVCYNRVGYYEVPNSRLIYRIGAQIRSLGIASMISWRGVWYVIHLGAVRRATAVGIVDAPSSGPGTSIPSATC